MNNAAVRSLCPQIHKYSPPTAPLGPLHFLHSSLSLVRPLSSARRCFTITWRPHFSSIQERPSSKLLEEYNFLRFLLSSAFEFQGKEKKKKKEPFWKCFATSKLHANSSRSGAGAMSSLFSHSKDQPHIRKTIADSPPTSLAANAKSLRVRPINVFRVCLLWGMWHQLNTSKYAVKYLHQYALKGFWRFLGFFCAQCDANFRPNFSYVCTHSAVYKLDGKSCVAITDLILPPVKFTALTSPFWEIFFFTHVFVPMCLLKLFFFNDLTLILSGCLHLNWRSFFYNSNFYTNFFLAKSDKSSCWHRGTYVP